MALLSRASSTPSLSAGMVAADPTLPQNHKVEISGAHLVLPALRAGENPEQQRVWIYCAELDEAKDLVSFCHGCHRPKIIPELVQKRGSDIGYGDLIRRCIPKLPAPYTLGEWDEFLTDADALISASVASSKLADSRMRSAAGSSRQEDWFRGLQSMRWPSLLVTDREKLIHALAHDEHRLRDALAEAASLNVEDLLTTVRAEDFGVITGNLVLAPSVDTCEPLSLTEAILSSSRFFGRQDVPAVDESSSSEPSQVIVAPGIYLQRPPEQLPEPSLYGSLALALLGNGQCAYCAMSSDGIRSVELSGTWEVVNGQIVLSATGRKSTSATHFLLSGAEEERLNFSYDEPVYLSLDEFEANFAPLDLTDLMPEGSEHLYDGLVKNYNSEETLDDDARSEATPPGTADRSANLGASSPSPARLQRQESPASPESPDKRSRSRPMALDAIDEKPKPLEASLDSMRTPQHALKRLASTGSSLSQTALSQQLAPMAESPQPTPKPEGFPGELIPSSPAPRLLGTNRGIARSKLPLRETRKHLDTPSHQGEAVLTGGLPFVSVIQNLTSYVSTTTRNGSISSSSYDMCSLSPGTYTFESGEKGKDNYKSLEMVLHADGSCKYHESARGSTLRSISGAACWRVHGGILVVDTKKIGAHGLALRECRGTRVAERRATKVNVPVEVIRRCCNFEPFIQRVQPFLGHSPAPESHLIFGMIDSASPVLRTMKCRPERLPYLGFEAELRRHGLPCDKIVSDFHFLDRDEDWQITVSDIRRLETYGTPLAAPEVLQELRDSLAQRYGSLDSAWEAVSLSAAKQRLSLEEFETFLAASAEEIAQGEKMPAGSQQKLSEWMEANTAEERTAVFSSLSHGSDTIDVTDFLSLNLHAAVVALRRLEHFQGWIREQFGASKEAYTRVFQALDKDGTRTLSRKSFSDGLKRLGYGFASFANSMFTLLDRNFNGELTLHNFGKLCDFCVTEKLMNLEALKSTADECFKGVDECYRWMLTREQAAQGTSTLPRIVSFAVFQQMCKKAKFSKRAPNADLRMLFLFLDLASGKQRSDGNLTRNEFALLKGLDSRALAGSPARLCRILQQEYESLDRAFELMHTSWLSRALPQGLRQTALTRVARMLSSPPEDHRSSAGSPGKSPQQGFLPPVQSAAKSSCRAGAGAGKSGNLPPIMHPPLLTEPKIYGMARSQSMPNRLGRSKPAAQADLMV